MRQIKILIAILLLAGKIYAQPYGISSTSTANTTNPTNTDNISTDRTVVGYGAGATAWGPVYNSFFGYNAGAVSNLSSGGNNSFFGAQAGMSNTSGGQNTFLGCYSGMLFTTGVENTMVGHGAGSGGSNFNGSGNTFIGSDAGGGAGVTGGDNNCLLGFQSNLTASGLSFATAIGAQSTVGTSNSIVLGRELNGGAVQDFVGIGTSTPMTQFHVVLDVNDNVRIQNLQAITPASPYTALVLDGSDNVKTANIFSFGQNNCPGGGSDPAALSSDRYVPLNNFNLVFPDGPSSLPTGGAPQSKVGIGTCFPGAKLHVYRSSVSDDNTPMGIYAENADISNDPVNGIAGGGNFNVSSTTNPTAVGASCSVADALHQAIGIYGEANCTGSGGIGAGGALVANVPNGEARGVNAEANGGVTSYGGHFYTNGAADNTGGYFEAVSSGNGITNGIYAVGTGLTPGVSLNMNACAAFLDGDAYITGLYGPSDEKLKTNVKEYGRALDQLKKLKTKTYDYKVEQYQNSMVLPTGNQIGIMAQNLQEVFPGLVKEKIAPAHEDHKTHKPLGENTKFLAVNYTGLIPVLVAAVNELDAKTEENAKLKAALDNTNAEMAALRQQLNDICNSGCAGLRGNGNIDAQPGNQLMQNVPNPFSGQTTIGYVVNTGNVAYMNINGLDGKLIRHMELTKGVGTVTINGNELSAGTYTYSLYVDDKVIDTKLMVISASK